MPVLRKSIRSTAMSLLVMVAILAPHADASDENLRNELGITYAKEGHFEDALRSFSLVLAADPQNAAALNNSANIYFVQGEDERARKLYERAIDANPQEGGIHLNLGILLHSIGESQASAASVRQGLDLIGDPHQAYYMLGLSQRPPTDNDRAADANDLKSSEIEELLAAAMADIPTAAKVDKSKSESETASAGSQQAASTGSTNSVKPAVVSTRPGGAKASEAGSESSPDIVADRLFWMSTSQSH